MLYLSDLKSVRTVDGAIAVYAEHTPYKFTLTKISPRKLLYTVTDPYRTEPLIFSGMPKKIDAAFQELAKKIDPAEEEVSYDIASAFSELTDFYQKQEKFVRELLGAGLPYP
jgi:hypothetical protein